MPSPMCWATSSDSRCLVPASSNSHSSLLYISGIESTGNSMSTTGPMTRAIRPPAPSPAPVFFSSTVAVMSLNSLRLAWTRGLGLVRLLAGSVGVGERVHATDDLADLLGDARLPGLVGDAGVLLDELLGVVRRGLHRLLPSGELGGRGLEQREEDAALDVLGQQRVQHLLGRGLELVEREGLFGGMTIVGLDDLQRQHPYVVRLLHQHRPELGVDQVHLVDVLGLALVGGERVDQRLTDLLGVLVARLVGEARPALHDVTATEPEVRL